MRNISTENGGEYGGKRHCGCLVPRGIQRRCSLQVGGLLNETLTEPRKRYANNSDWSIQFSELTPRMRWRIYVGTGSLGTSCPTTKEDRNGRRSPGDCGHIQRNKRRSPTITVSLDNLRPTFWRTESANRNAECICPRCFLRHPKRA